MAETLQNQVVIGETYRMIHQRKGTAVVRVTGLAGEWIDIVVVEGTLRGMGQGSLREVGDEERVRDSLARFVSV